MISLSYELSFLEKKERMIDEALQLERKIVKLSSFAVKSLHANKWEEAENAILLASQLVKKLSAFDEVYSVKHAQQEFVEAVELFSLLKEGKLIGRKGIERKYKVKIKVEAFVLGLADLVGEIKRAILLFLMNKEIKKGVEMYKVMRALYDNLAIFRFSNATLPEFRRKLDVARIQVDQIEMLITQIKVMK